MARASVPADLRFFKAGDSHEDVVEVGAAPPQHVHPLLTAFLPQLIDGIFCARRREKQRERAHTKQKHSKPTGRPLPSAASSLISPRYYLSWVLTSSPV